MFAMASRMRAMHAGSDANLNQFLTVDGRVRTYLLLPAILAGRGAKVSSGSCHPEGSVEREDGIRRERARPGCGGPRAAKVSRSVRRRTGWRRTVRPGQPLRESISSLERVYFDARRLSGLGRLRGFAGRCSRHSTARRRETATAASANVCSSRHTGRGVHQSRPAAMTGIGPGPRV